jgi:transposase
MVYARAAMERAMKVQGVILRVISKQIHWFEAAKILGMSARQLRRLYYRYRTYGCDGLYDRRTGKPSPRRVPLRVAEQVLVLYRERYFDSSVRHFHEKLWEEHGILLSYSWAKLALQGAGLVAKARQRGVGMLLHMDGSRHRWLGGELWHNLIVVVDDAASEIYYAQLFPLRSDTRTTIEKTAFA